MKEKWNKVLKADGTTYYWIVRENKGANGWGNGYVALPPGPEVNLSNAKFQFFRSDV